MAEIVDLKSHQTTWMPVDDNITVEVGTIVGCGTDHDTTSGTGVRSISAAAGVAVGRYQHGKPDCGGKIVHSVVGPAVRRGHRLDIFPARVYFRIRRHNRRHAAVNRHKF